MSDVILSVENVSKLYRLGTVGTGTFGGDVQRFWKTKILGQEDPFLKIGQTNDRTSKEKVEFVWALQDINFQVKRGEVLGIIGKNGAGKSTLLKLLSRITSPTTGSIKSGGRMASLLEVGTGFHPELTGRENIYLNGAILGMTKKEIQNKFDEIVDFSGCQLYIDTPTKRYSSGMTVRLGFAIAAFLDPEILVVDEVLAVGDAEFQKKAIGKMKEVSQGGGRTVLFVSHNLVSIENLCDSVLIMNNGKVEGIYPTKLGINKYVKLQQNIVDFNLKERYGNGNFRFFKTYILNNENNRVEELIPGKTYTIVAEYKRVKEVDNTKLMFAININTSLDISVCDLSTDFSITHQNINQETGIIQCKIIKFPLGVGEYKYNLMLRNNNEIEDWVLEAHNFAVIRGDYYGTGKLPDDGYLMYLDCEWKN